MIFGIIDTIIIGGLVGGDMRFGGEVVGVISVHIEMVRFELTDNGDVRRFFEIPELEARHFVNDDGAGGEGIEDIYGRLADIADEVSVAILGIEEGFDERASGTFAFRGGNADDGAGTAIEEISSDGRFVGKM